MDKSSPDYIFSAAAAIAEIVPNGRYCDAASYGNYVTEFHLNFRGLINDSHIFMLDTNRNRKHHLFFRLLKYARTLGYNFIEAHRDIDLVMAKLLGEMPKKPTIKQWLQFRKKNKAIKRCLVLLTYRTSKRNNSEWLVIDGYKIAKYRDKTPSFLIENNLRCYYVNIVIEQI